MTERENHYTGQRISYDGALCTVRSKDITIPGTKGKWLGVEWDEVSRGKHDGTHVGIQYFKCRSHQPTVASFVRPTRKADAERTILEAIRYKYGVSGRNDEPDETVTFSGKVAEEIGFDEIIKAQSALENLKIVIVDHLTINGVAPRGSSKDAIRRAQDDLSIVCPNVAELDLGHNPIESWIDIEDICKALPNLRILRLNSVRFRDLTHGLHSGTSNCFQNIQELHLNECLVRPLDILQILHGTNGSTFPSLRSLWLSQNELSDFVVPNSQFEKGFEGVQDLVLENNLFTSLDPLTSLLSLFPSTSHVSLQSNKISSFGSKISIPGQPYPKIISLNLSQNDITSFSFIDDLPKAFSNLSSLRISRNPVYYRSQSEATSNKPSETTYYLALARIPSLKTLNYTDITPRDRDEGEFYYLSVAEKEIRSTLTNVISRDSQSVQTAIDSLTRQYPRYAPLCEKHDRDNVITQLTSATSSADITKSSVDQAPSQPTYPAGSIASRLVTSTFYIPSPSPSPSSAITQPTTSFTRQIPNTIPTSSIFALVCRELHVRPLSFKLIYESEELDPATDDTTTRSQLYDKSIKGEERWNAWGDWDADELVEKSLAKSGEDHTGEDETKDGANAARDRLVSGGVWTDDGTLLKDGRKWRKREVDVLFSVRDWGDWLEDGVKECRIRVVPVDRNKFGPRLDR